MKIKTQILTLLFIMGGFGFALAQSKTEDLHIDKVFSSYGKSKGSVKVELDLRDEENYYYKSLVTTNNLEAIDLAKACIAKDKQKAKKIKEVYAEGKPTTIYLSLKPKEAYYRFVLFNDNGKGKMTLVYIESENKEILKIILKKQ